MIFFILFILENCTFGFANYNSFPGAYLFLFAIGYVLQTTAWFARFTSWPV